PSPRVAASPFPATLSDFQNRSVTVPSRPERLVSIGPSITAFLFALGAGPRVVGVDDFSDEPAEAATREHVGGIKVNFEKVVALKPDLVFSVKFSDGTIEKLQSASLNVLVVDPQTRSRDHRPGGGPVLTKTRRRRRAIGLVDHRGGQEQSHLHDRPEPHHPAGSERRRGRRGVREARSPGALQIVRTLSILAFL